MSLSDVMFNDNASNHGSIYSEPAYIAGKSDQEKICDNCRQSMARPATASYWYPNSVAHIASPRRYCGKLGDCNISSLRHPDGASNPNLKEEVERLPGNGASGSDPEEEYVEAKKLFTAAERSERTVTGKSDIEEEMDGKIQGEIQQDSFEIDNLNDSAKNRFLQQRHRCSCPSRHRPHPRAECSVKSRVSAPRWV